MVCGVDPKLNYISKKRTRGYSAGRTTRLAEVEANEDTHDTSDDENETEEVEFCDMLPQGLAMVRIQVQEDEENGERDPTGGPEMIRVSDSVDLTGMVTPTG